MIDSETKALLLRVAVVSNVIFGIFSYKAAESYSFLKRILNILSYPRKYINIGVMLRSDSKGTRGNFSLPVLLVLTAFIIYSYICYTNTFKLVILSPIGLIRSSTFSWKIWDSLWLLPVNIIITSVIFMIGLTFTLMLWMFILFIVVKTLSWIAELLRNRFSKSVFEVLAFLLLAISGILTFFLI